MIECTDDAYQVVRLYTDAYRSSTTDLLFDFEEEKEERMGADAVELFREHRAIDGQDAMVVAFDHHGGPPATVDTRQWHVLLALHGQSFHLQCSVRDDVKDTPENACPTILSTLTFERSE